MREGSTQSDSQSSSNPGFARIRILGSLGKKDSRNVIDIELNDVPTKLGSLIEILHTKCELDLGRDSTLVMVNGVEARALEDLNTIVRSGDEVVFVPVFHGG